MKTYRKTVDDQTHFVVADVDPALHDTLRGLYYSEFEDGFAKAYPVDTPHLDRIFENFARLMPDLILQAAKLQPAPWEKSLRAFLDLIAGHEFDWWVVGSGALAVRGLPVAPGDLDLVVQGQASDRLCELLLDYMVEPVQLSPDWIWGSFGRAFLHARLEWAGDVNASAESDPAQVVDFGLTALERGDTVDWQGHAIRVPPLDLQLAVCQQRGLAERAALIQGAIDGQ